MSIGRRVADRAAPSRNIRRSDHDAQPANGDGPAQAGFAACFGLSLAALGRFKQREIKMLDHIQFDVKDLEKSKAFYKATLAPLGYELIYEVNGSVGFGAGGSIDFCLQSGKQTIPGVPFPLASSHTDLHQRANFTIFGGGNC